MSTTDKTEQALPPMTNSGRFINVHEGTELPPFFVEANEPNDGFTVYVIVPEAELGAMRAALAQRQQVPEGWQLVPVVPTEDMLFAAEMSQPRGYRDLYTAMVDAAPALTAAPPAQPQSEPQMVAPQDGMQFWLWKNGDHFLAFTHLYPCFAPGGDPMVLGDPVGRAVFRRSFDRHEREQGVAAAQPPERAAQQEAQEAAGAGRWDGAEEWMPLAWELCADECGEEACTELVWEGGPVPEPWGERWLKYEDEAKRLIALVRKHVPATPPRAVEPMPALTDEQIDLIANDGMRNAAGGIYATLVYEFARAIERAHGINGGA